MPIINWWSKVWKSIEEHGDKKYDRYRNQKTKYDAYQKDKKNLYPTNFSTIKVCYEVV